MPPAYRYHVFLSYGRSGDVGQWVRNHFYPVLLGRLEALLDEPPSLFIDQDITVGSDWPQTLAHALHHSCCMVAVWSPSYFRSQWCMAEWSTILERERTAGLRLQDGTAGLVYPVVYSDGDSFPEDAKKIQSRQVLAGKAGSDRPASRRCVGHASRSEYCQRARRLRGEQPTAATCRN